MSEPSSRGPPGYAGSRLLVLPTAPWDDAGGALGVADPCHGVHTCSVVIHHSVDAGREHASSFDVVLMSGVGQFVMMEDSETFDCLLGEIVVEYAGT